MDDDKTENLSEAEEDYRIDENIRKKELEEEEKGKRRSLWFIGSYIFICLALIFTLSQEQLAKCVIYMFIIVAVVIVVFMVGIIILLIRIKKRERRVKKKIKTMEEEGEKVENLEAGARRMNNNNDKMFYDKIFWFLALIVVIAYIIGTAIRGTPPLHIKIISVIFFLMVIAKICIDAAGKEKEKKFIKIEEQKKENREIKKEQHEELINSKKNRIEKLKLDLEEAKLQKELEIKIEAEKAELKLKRAEAEEAIAKIKKRTAALFEKPKKGMTAGELLRDKEKRRQKYLKVVEEVVKGKSPKEQDRIWAEAYQEIENIK